MFTHTRRRVGVAMLAAFSLLAPIGVMVAGGPSAAAAGSDSTGNMSVSFGDLIVNGAPATTASPTVSPGDSVVFNVRGTCSLTAAQGGCGPATMTVTFPPQMKIDPSLVATPNGATMTVVGQTFTFTWAFTPNENSPTIVIPVTIDPNTPAAQNGMTGTVTAKLVAPDNGRDMNADDSVTYQVSEKPGVAAGASTWVCVTGTPATQCTGSTLVTVYNSATDPDTGGAKTTYTVNATQQSNLPSSVTYSYPSTAALTANTSMLNAFNLTNMMLNGNVGGATITLTMADSSTQTVNVAAGQQPIFAGIDLTQVTGYTVVFNAVPTGQSTGVVDTVQLRKTLRSNGLPVTSASATNTGATVQAQTDIFTTTPDGQKSIVLQPSLTMTVNSAPVALSSSKTWVTDFGNDQASVYGSHEPNTIDILAANTSPSTIQSLTIAEPAALSGQAFNYFAMTGANITFPAGTGVVATVQYFYGTSGTIAGGTFTMSAGGAAPDPSTDPTVSGKTWADVWQMVVKFTAPGGEIDPCASLAPASACAAELKIRSVLRDKLMNGNPMAAPTNTTGVPVANQALVSAVGDASATGTSTTNSISVNIVPPQYTVKASKQLGSPHVSYALNGTDSAGDFAGEPYAQHTVILKGGATANPGADPAAGPATLTFSDPSVMVGTAPANFLTALKNPANGYFFASVMLTALSASPTVDCANTAVAGAPVTISDASVDLTKSIAYVVTVDGAGVANGITQVPLATAAAGDLSLIVGIQYVVLPPPGMATFPADVSCTLNTGASVQWRTNRLSDGSAVVPGAGGTTPGLLSAGNTLDVRSGDAATYTAIAGFKASDNYSMYLVDRPRATGYKGLASGAAIAGIQGQGATTSFSVAGAVVGSDTNALKVTDGVTGSATYNSSFDIFALTGLRNAQVGPYQTLTVYLTACGTAGTTATTPCQIIYKAVANAASAALPAGMVVDDGTDSQSSYYHFIYNQVRTFTWYASSDNGVTWGGAIAAPTAAQLANVSQVDAVAVPDTNVAGFPKDPKTNLPARTTPLTVLPQFSAINLVIDVQLRSTRLWGDLVNGSPLILGSPTPGTAYFNYASILASNDGGATYTPSIMNQYAAFIVLDAPVYVDARIVWAGSGTNDSLATHTGATSTISLSAYNNSAVAGDCPTNEYVTDTAPFPADSPYRWACKGAMGVGISTLQASVGLPAANTAATPNPFTLVAFNGVTSLTLPGTVRGGVASGTATAVIRYYYADGNWVDVTTTTLPGANPPAIAPANATTGAPGGETWADIVGVTVTFTAPPGYFIGTHSNATDSATNYSAAPQSNLTFSTTLRDTSRPTCGTPDPESTFTCTPLVAPSFQGGYTFTSGPTGSLADGDAIDGPPHDSAVPDVATAYVAVVGTLVTPTDNTSVSTSVAAQDIVNIWAQDGGLTVSKKWTPAGGVNANGDAINTLYRDRAPSTTFTITTGIAGKVAVDQIRIGDDAGLLDEATWPSATTPLGTTPAGWSGPAAGSFFDAFNLTGIQVTQVPTTTSAAVDTVDLTVWFLTSSGWYKYSTKANPNGNCALDSNQSGVVWNITSTGGTNGTTTTGALPAGLVWSDVIGLRVEFDGRAGCANSGPVPKMIPSNATFTVTGTLRQNLRSDSAKRAPGGDDLGGLNFWTVPNTVDASTYVKSPSGLRPLVVGTTAVDYADIYPGAPLIATVKQVAAAGWTPSVGAVSGLPGTQAQAVQPGTYAAFFIGVTNNGNASAPGSLFDAQFQDVLPASGDLKYTGTLGHEATLVIDSLTPAALVANPDLLAFDQITMTWSLDPSVSVAPGQHVAVRVPLLVADGLDVGTVVRNDAIAVGHGLNETAIPTSCKASLLDTAPADVAGNGSTANCTNFATVNVVAATTVRAEKYAQTPQSDGLGGVSTAGPCNADTTPNSMLAGSGTDFYADPCQVPAGPGTTVTYRVKLINSGNTELKQFRFVDALPILGDTGSINNHSRGSTLTGAYVPGSLQVVTSGIVDASGHFRTDATLTNPQFSTTQNPCTNTDIAGASGLACGGGWTSSDVGARSLKADVTLSDDLQGGDYVIVQFAVTLPETAVSGDLAVNDAVISGLSATLGWLDATASTAVTAEYSTADLTLTKQVTNPSGALVGNVTLTLIDCTLGSEPYTPDTVSFSHVMGTDLSYTWPALNLPVGVTCTVHETDFGGADVQAADQTVTIQAGGNPVTMTNGLSAQTLTVNAVVAGSATSPLASWVPLTYQINVQCTRTVDGVTVVDFDTADLLSLPTVTAPDPNTGLGGTSWDSPALPTGTRCVVSEVPSDPAPADVLASVTAGSITDADAVAQTATVTMTADGTVTFTNTFEASDITVTHSIVDNGAAPWHLNNTSGLTFVMAYECLSPAAQAADSGPDISGTLTFTGPATAGAADLSSPDEATWQTQTISGLQVGTVCQITSEFYAPTGYSSPYDVYYGTFYFPDLLSSTATFSASLSETGFDAAVSGMATVPNPKVRSIPGEIDIVTQFTPTTLDLTKTVDDQTGFVDPANQYAFTTTCDLGGVNQTFGPYTVSAGDPAISLTGGTVLATGVICTVTETTNYGATSSVVTLDSNTLTGAGNTVTTVNLSSTATHDIAWQNVFAAGADLQIVKDLTRPTLPDGTAMTVGDFQFTLACTLDGVPLVDTGGVLTFTLSFASTDTSLSHTISGLPEGAICTVTETDSAGADLPAAPHPNVTVLAADSAPVVVDMTNIYDPAELDLNVAANGAAVDAGMPWVPTAWDVQVTCTRSITINGTATTVTDYDAPLTVTAGVMTPIGPLPAGSQCLVSEPDSKGANAVMATVTAPATDTDAVNETATTALLGAATPGSGIAQPTAVTITNTYELATVIVHEQVQGPAPAGVQLPFTVTASYVDYQGATIQFTLPATTAAFTLGAAGTLTFDAPLGSALTITQTDQKGSMRVYTVVAGTKTAQARNAQNNLPAEFDITFINVWAQAATGGSVAPSPGLGGMLACLMITLGGVVIRRRTQFGR